MAPHNGRTSVGTSAPSRGGSPACGAPSPSGDGAALVGVPPPAGAWASSSANSYNSGTLARTPALGQPSSTGTSAPSRGGSPAGGAPPPSGGGATPVGVPPLAGAQASLGNHSYSAHTGTTTPDLSSNSAVSASSSGGLPSVGAPPSSEGGAAAGGFPPAGAAPSFASITATSTSSTFLNSFSAAGAKRPRSVDSPGSPDDMASCTASKRQDNRLSPSKNQKTTNQSSTMPSFKLRPQEGMSECATVEEMERRFPELRLIIKPNLKSEFIIRPRNRASLLILRDNYAHFLVELKPELRERKAIISGFPLEFPLAILTNLSFISSAERCRHRQGFPTRSVLATFIGPIPDKVDAHNWGTYSTSKYNPEPLRCYNCQRFGHHRERCSFRVTCAICSGRHETQVCLDKHKSGTNTTAKCPNCKASHHAWNRQCPKRLERIQPRQLPKPNARPGLLPVPAGLVPLKPRPQGRLPPPNAPINAQLKRAPAAGFWSLPAPAASVPSTSLPSKTSNTHPPTPAPRSLPPTSTPTSTPALACPPSLSTPPPPPSTPTLPSIASTTNSPAKTSTFERPATHAARATPAKNKIYQLDGDTLTRLCRGIAATFAACTGVSLPRPLLEKAIQNALDRCDDESIITPIAKPATKSKHKRKSQERRRTSTAKMDVSAFSAPSGAESSFASVTESPVVSRPVNQRDPRLTSATYLVNNRVQDRGRFDHPQKTKTSNSNERRVPDDIKGLLSNTPTKPLDICDFPSLMPHSKTVSPIKTPVKKQHPGVAGPSKNKSFS